MNDPNDSTGTGDGPLLSSKFLELCAKVRNSDPSVLPEPGQPLRISRLSEKEVMELADALLEKHQCHKPILGDVKSYEKLCRSNGQVRAYQQVLTTHLLGQTFDDR
jgi:hypothetical protein